MGFKSRPNTKRNKRAGDKLRRRTHRSATAPSPVRDPKTSSAWERRVEGAVVRAFRTCDYAHAQSADVIAIVGARAMARGQMEDGTIAYTLRVKHDWYRAIEHAKLAVVDGYFVLDTRPLSETALYVDDITEATFVAAGRGARLHCRKGLIARTPTGPFMIPYGTGLDANDAQRKALRKLARDARERAFLARRGVG